MLCWHNWHCLQADSLTKLDQFSILVDLYVYWLSKIITNLHQQVIIVPFIALISILYVPFGKDKIKNRHTGTQRLVTPLRNV